MTFFCARLGVYICATLALVLLTVCPTQGAETKPDLARIVSIVMTGGPCAGKSTFQAFFSKLLEELGWRVYTPKEVATTVFQGRATFDGLSEADQLVFQAHILNLILGTEDMFFHQAKCSAGNGEKSVILFDRGFMDASTYIEQEAWKVVLEHLKLDEDVLKHTRFGMEESTDLKASVLSTLPVRYDAVLHMVTAANGAERYYSSESNEIRYEPASKAVALDDKQGAAWRYHPNYIRVDNEDKGFEEKLLLAARILLGRVLGETEIDEEMMQRVLQQVLYPSSQHVPPTSKDGVSHEETSLVGVLLSMVAPVQGEEY